MSAALPTDNGYGYPIGATRILVVGVEGVVVGVEGVVQAHDQAAGTVTINGHVLPLTLGSESGVKYLSCIWPQDDHSEQCSGVADEDEIDAAVAKTNSEWSDRVLKNHEREHEGPMRWCQHPLCVVADRRGESA